jgi:multiple sugar transport system substrate-binding protein
MTRDPKSFDPRRGFSLDRRTFLSGSAAVALGGALSGPFASRKAMAQAAAAAFKPEDGASLRLLRWVPFVKGEEDAWNANTAAFTEATGVEVRIDQESWEDVRPKAAVAANVGSGPDIVMTWFDDPFQYPDKLVDVTDLATALGDQYGGWYEGLEGYARQGDTFIALPLCAIANAICYRDSHMKAAGFDEFPKDTAGFLELCKALKANGTPAGFPHGKAVGDGNNYAHWLLWSHGGMTVDENGKVAINSPETKAAIEYAIELYKTFIPGTESWLDINNNRAFLAGQISLTANGVSLYYAAANDPALKEIAEDIRTTNLPVGPVGKSVELHQTTTLSIFKHSQYPNAAKAYLNFMYQAEQMNKWLEGASAYCCQPLKDFADNPVWTSNPAHAAYANASATLRPNGYAGPLGPASAGVMADYVVVDMFAEAVTGQRTPEEAIANAERRIARYYR